MPRVPTYDGQKVQEQALPGVRNNNTLSPDDFGAGMGRSLQTVATVGAQVHMEAVEKADVAAVDAETNNSLYPFEKTKLNDPKDGFLRKEGRDAIASSQAVYDDLDKTIAGSMNRLTNERQKRMFAERADKFRQSISRRIDEHVGTQVHKFETGEKNAAAQNAREAAATNWNDPDRVRLEFDNGQKAVLGLAELNGEGPEVSTARLNTFRSDFHRSIVESAMAGNDVKFAGEYLAKYGGDINANDRERLQGAVENQMVNYTAMGEAERILFGATSLADARKQTKDIKDLRVREQTDRHIMSEFSRREDAAKADRDAAFEMGSKVIEGGGTTLMVNPALMARMSSEQIAALERRQEQIAKRQEVKTDPKVWMQVREMTPEQITKMSQADVWALRADLSESDWREMVDKREMFIRAAGKETPETSEHLSFEKAVDDAARRAGILSYMKSDQAVELANFRTNALREIRAREVGGKKLSVKDRDAIIERLAVEKVEIPGAHWYSFNRTVPKGLVTPEDSKNVVTPIKDIPDAAKKNIQKLLSESGGGVFAKDDPVKIGRIFSAAQAGDDALIEKILKE